MEHKGSGIRGVEVMSALEDLASKGKKGFEVNDLETLRGVKELEGKEGVVVVNNLEKLDRQGDSRALEVTARI